MKIIIFIIFLLFSVSCSDDKADNDKTIELTDEATIKEYVPPSMDFEIARGSIVGTLPDELVDEVELKFATELCCPDGDIMVEIGIYPDNPIITFINPYGKRATLDFSGGKIAYSGELSVDESAKMFFDSFNHLTDGIEIE